jgi:uncharacterized membrane protein
MLQNPLYVLFVLCLNIVLAEVAVRYTILRHLGTAFTVILFTAIVANVGLLPSSTNAPPVYDGIFSYVAPLSIFFLMLGVNLNSIRQAGTPMLLMFLVGSVGTVLGAFVGMWLIGGAKGIGPQFHALGGMYTGTYIGGSVNFNAVALHYDISKSGSLFAAATAADNILSAIWVAATIAIPQVLKRFFPQQTHALRAQQATHRAVVHEDAETISPLDLGLLLALGFGAIVLAGQISALVPQVPSVLILTTLALGLAQLPIVQRLRGNKMLGLFCIYLFLSVIGAYCDIPALLQDGTLALQLLLFVSVLVLVHALVIFGVGTLFKQDWDLLGIASQANIGGAGSAMACARSLNRPDYELPAILVGSLGNATGTYWGILVAELMLRMFS